MESEIPFVLSQYNINPAACRWAPLGKGHIHATYKVEGPRTLVLQQFNDRVFTKPEVVERNIRLAAEYLRARNPGYLFVSPVPAINGRDLVYDSDGRPWRLSPFVDNSFSIDEVSTTDQAFRAAAAFGKFGRLLEGVNTSGFQPTIDRFHDLSFRFSQFRDALSIASEERMDNARDVIKLAHGYDPLVTKYEDLVSRRILRERVFHNDTKVNNVLFDEDTREALAVVDLDTLMPGYFIYDLGDLLRTMTSPVSEEEGDLEKIVFRKAFYQAVVEGYMSEMRATLSPDELKQVAFSGQMMTCIMAVRFLADYLRGDTYYHTTYPGQNLVRAKNQFRLLQHLESNA